MKLIVGLGNPESKYANTRHNFGFMVIDELLKKFNFQVVQIDDKTSLFVGNHISLIKPSDGMNNSGFAVRKALNFLSFNQIDMALLYDDMDFELGTIKLKLSGSAGGHNGVKSVMEMASKNDFLRIRLGIGRPLNATLIDHVLSEFNTVEIPTVHTVVSRAVDIVRHIEHNDFVNAMNKYNIKEY